LGAMAPARTIVAFAVTMQFDDRAALRRFLAERLYRARMPRRR
jgi:tetraacyldisaccharide 4'-kinase